MTRSVWKPPYVNYKLVENLLINKNKESIKTSSRATTILESFIGLTFSVHTGKSFSNVYVTEKMVGHKLGEFAFTRKVGKIHNKKVKTVKKIKK